jgi:ABC-type glycerol-3-phosphate transport system substrate-binding protein
MKMFKTLSLSALLTLAAVNTASATSAVVSAFYNETPVKTVVIKHPMANDAAKFFSSSKIVNFEIYKPGTKEEVAKIIASLKKDAAVESVNEGVVTGDYHAVTIVLKSEKNKEWFAAEFKKAGLNTIKMNNNPIVEVDKL